MAENAPELAASRSRIDRAGRRIRHRTRDGEEPLADDLVVLDEFRAWHLPTTVALQEMLTEHFHEHTTLDQEVLPITSRWKTPEAIRAKLCRSSTALSRMQDIAGARVVVPTLGAQDWMVSQILELVAHCAPRDPKDTREDADYTGYRAVHIIIALDERLAEIQVRTVRQDAWAQIIEDVDARTGWDLKHGQGPAEWRSWFQNTSDELRNADLGLPSEIPPAPYDETREVEE